MDRLCDIITDAIAINAIDPNTIITGKGNELYLFFVRNEYPGSITSKALNIKLFTYNIYGIESSNEVEGEDSSILNQYRLLLIHGGREFLLISTINYKCIEKVKFDEIYRANLTDWIIAARILNHQEFVLLTAHSVILRFKDNQNTNFYELIERVSCDDKSVLYCSKILGNIWEELVVFSGNAFGEILIWQPHINFYEANFEQIGTKSIKRSLLIKRLVAHKGVIFSIDYDKTYNLLVTTSDDRSTKWFQVKFPENNQFLWSEASIQPVVSVFGHGARVFKGSVISNVRNNDHKTVNKKNNYYIISVGEDSCFCLWNSEGKLLLKRRQQHGAIIWNFIYIKEIQTVYTIGSAGNLIAYDISMMLKEPNNKLDKNSAGELLPHLTSNCNEYFAKIKFLNSNGDIIVGITNYNNLFHLKQSKMETNLNRDWKPWTICIDFKCTVFEVLIESDHSLLALCGHHRLILLKINFSPALSTTTIYNGNLSCGLIRSFIFLSKDLYLIGDNFGQMLLLPKVCRNFEHLPTLSNSSSKEKEAWPISGLYLNCNPENGNKEHLIISTRQGFLILYSRNQNNIAKNFIEETCIRHSHGNFGATCIYLKYRDQNKAIICTYGRNNTILWYKIDLYLSNMEVINLERFPICWTAAIIDYKPNMHLENLIIGFNDNHLVIWSQQHNILAEFPCGGGYRSWHHCLIIDKMLKTTYLKIIYVKAKKIFQYIMPIYNKALMTTTTLVRRWHTAACNAIVSTNSGLLVTAGEDNLIKLWHFIDSTAEIQLWQDLHFHISTVKVIKILKNTMDSYILFSGGGRGQLCITHIKDINIQCQVKLLLNHTISSGVSNNINCLESYNYKTDVRIMAIDVLMVNESSQYIYKIYMGCSDGYVRCLHFDPLNGKMMQEKAIDIINYKKCILHLRTISSLNCLLTATTDGKLQYYNLNNYMSIPELYNTHHSAIMALDILHRKDQSVIQILYGSDDQSIIYMQYFCNTPEKQALDGKSKVFSKCKYISRNDLHSSQVTGVTIEKNGLYGYTAGNDRIIYQLDLQNDCLVLRSLQSSIADIKGINLFIKANQLYCLIFGNGFEIYTSSRI